MAPLTAGEGKRDMQAGYLQLSYYFFCETCAPCQNAGVRPALALIFLIEVAQSISLR